MLDVVNRVAAVRQRCVTFAAVVAGALTMTVGMPTAASARDDRPSDPAPQAAPANLQPQPGAPVAPRAGLPAPLTIAVVGNHLVLTCDDPRTLSEAQHLLTFLAAQAVKPTFAVVKLKTARASDVAELLDELFNGRTEVGVEPLRINGVPSLVPVGPRGTVPTVVTVALPTEPNRIRVVADNSRNLVVIRARQSDQVHIRKLIDEAIDVIKTDSLAVTRPWLLAPLRYAHANEVARVVRSLYFDQTREGMYAAARFTGLGPFNGYGSFVGAPLGADAVYARQPPPLAIAVEERTNSLIVACSEAMKDEIQAAVRKLDVLAQSAQRIVKVVSVRGADPARIADAIEAVLSPPVVWGPYGPGLATPWSGPYGAGPTGGSGNFGRNAPFAGTPAVRPPGYGVRP